MMPCTAENIIRDSSATSLRIPARHQPLQRLVHQVEGIHHHDQDVLGEGAVLLHPVLEQRAQQIGVLGREIEIGRGQPVELADRVVLGNARRAGRSGLNRLPVHRQDHPVEVAELIIDAPIEQSAASAMSRTFNDLNPLDAIKPRAISRIRARRLLFFCSRKDSS